MSDNADVRDRLIAAALRLLERTGEEPSLRAVARAAGVSAMTPYGYIRNKADLMAAVSTRGFEMLANALERADDNPDSVVALTAQGVAVVEFARAHPALFRLMYSHQYGSAGTAAIQRTAEILSSRVSAILPEHAAPFVLACRSLAQGMATLALNDRLGSAKPEDIETAMRLFAEGFGGSR